MFNIASLPPLLFTQFYFIFLIRYGIIHGGGAGKFLAEWILNGEPTYDLTEIDPLRYATYNYPQFILKNLLIPLDCVHVCIFLC